MSGATTSFRSHRHPISHCVARTLTRLVIGALFVVLAVLVMAVLFGANAGCANTGHTITDGQLGLDNATMPSTRVTQQSITHTGPGQHNSVWASADGVVANDIPSTMIAGLTIFGPGDGTQDPTASSLFFKLAQDAVATGLSFTYVDDDSDGIPEHVTWQAATYDGSGSAYIDKLAPLAEVFVELLKQQSADQREVTLEAIRTAVPELGDIVEGALRAFVPTVPSVPVPTP